MNTISKTFSLSATLILLLAGCSQQQVSTDGASQVAGSSQAQQVSDCPSCNTPKIKPVILRPAVSASGHTHSANQCTKSIRHNHPNGQRSHSHKYSCQGDREAVRGNKWAHSHPANRCTKSIRHTHKFQNHNHSHQYSCQGKGHSINIHALQRKLKAKGYYKGPVNGVINADTRSALKRYQQGRR